MRKVTAHKTGAKRKQRKILLSFLCMITVLCSTILTFVPSIRVQADSDGAGLKNLIIDKVYELTPVGESPTVLR